MEWMILPLKRYADFSGRSRRKEYWMFVLFLFLAYLLLTVIAVTMVGSMGAMSHPAESLPTLIASFGIFAVVLFLFWLGMLLPSLAVAVRRLHDGDRSGWWLMIYLVPYLLSIPLAVGGLRSPGQGLSAASSVLSLVSLVGGIVLLVFMFLPGTAGPNRFGADPKDPAGSADLKDVFG